MKQSNTEYVVLVNEQDQELGIMEKIQAHREGKLHRAVSVFIYNSKKELLLQKRAKGKYHSAGLWTNTCCSHPRPKESTLHAANRRLQEEMGISCAVEPAFHFFYKAHLENSMIENELDYVFTGMTDAFPLPNREEVEDWKYIAIADLEDDIRIHPEKYTVWFKICFTNWRENLIL